MRLFTLRVLQVLVQHAQRVCDCVCTLECSLKTSFVLASGYTKRGSDNLVSPIVFTQDYLEMHIQQNVPCVHT